MRGAALALALALAACAADHLVGENAVDFAAPPDLRATDLAHAVTDGPAGECNSIADCRLFSTACSTDTPMCKCWALSSNDPDPMCSGSMIACFADPCQFETLTCINHVCGMTP
jgi:hypothetical protein